MALICVYADIPVAIEALRAERTLDADAPVAIIDLDVHRGNGFEAIYEADRRIGFFDLYNFQIYPGRMHGARERFPHVIALRAHMDNAGYLRVLKDFLPEFLSRQPFSLAFYNAGTDVLIGDPLGRFDLDSDTVLERDRFVIESLDRAAVPWVMVPSGGYTGQAPGCSRKPPSARHPAPSICPSRHPQAAG